MARILLIEPDRRLAETYYEMLKSDGHQVVACASAQAGIIAADQHQPDAVLLELQLIEHSGIEFLYEFRSYPDWQDIPVVIHSQVPPAEFEASAEILRSELGVAGFFYKPQTTLKMLRRALSEALQPAAA